jgi:hypothetical protein
VVRRTPQVADSPCVAISAIIPHCWSDAQEGCSMTINVAFKSPDALVFATDGLATVFDVDAGGQVTAFRSHMPDVEKLVVLGGGSILAMFNGIGSIGRTTMAAALRSLDAGRPRRAQALTDWAGDLAARLWHLAFEEGRPPTPLHLIFGAFGADPAAPEPPDLLEVKWLPEQKQRPRGSPPLPRPVLAIDRGAAMDHQFGPYYAGASAAVSRFVEGFDPELPQGLAVALAGRGGPGPPGILEELIHLARAAAPAAAPLPPEAADPLVLRFARRVIRSAFPESAPGSLSEHFSLQSAVDYTVFLAQCAYAQETLSPARHGPPRVGSALQVAYLQRGAPAQRLAGIELGIRLPGQAGRP